MKITKVHDSLPIYSKIGYIPEYCIYALADNLQSQYWYCGETSDAIKRYKKYLRAVAGNDYSLNDGREKMDRFKAAYKAGEAPVMIILKEVESKEQARVVEKQYRQLFTDKGHPLINTTNKRVPYAKDIYQKRVYGIADFMYGKWIFTITIVTIIIIISFLMRNINNQNEYYY